MGEEENIEKELKASLFKFEDGLKTDKIAFFSLKEILSVYDYYYFKGDNIKAVTALNLAKSQHPYSADPYIKEAELNILFDNHLLAKEMIDKAKILEPNNEELIHLEIECLIKENKIEEAIERLYQGIQYAEHKVELYSYLVEICEMHELYDEAIKCMQEWSKIEDFNEFLLFELSKFYTKANKVNEGIEYFKSLIDDDPFNSILWSELGGLYEEKDDFNQAIWAYEYATLATDDYYSGHLNMANCYHHKEEYELMKEQLDVVNAIKPNSSELHLLFGRYYKEVSNYNTAKKHLLKSIDLKENQPESWFEMGTLLKDLGALTDAHPYFMTAFELYPSDEEYAIDYLFIDHEINGLTSAVQVFEKAKFDLSDNPELYSSMALIYCREKEYEEALRILVQKPKMQEQDAEINYLLSASNYALGHLKLAEEFLIKALSLNIESHKILFEAHPPLQYNQEVLNTIDLFKK